MKITLGSSSQGRKMVMEELGRELGFDFDVMIPDIDEKTIRLENPRELVMAIAHAKTDALIKKIKEPTILIVSDQVVLYDGEVREKPIDEDEAREFLRSYGHIPAETLGAVIVTNTDTGKRMAEFQTSKIYFKPLPESFIEAHIKSGVSFRGAGGFVIQDPQLLPYIDRIEGTFDSAAGLSKDIVKKLMAIVK